MLLIFLHLAFILQLSAATGKRGIGAPWDSIGSDLDQIPSNQKVGWYHNWETYRAKGGNQLEYVATLRTGHPDDIQRFQTNMPTNGARSLICLNEPNESSQANLSPQDAARIWRQYCWPQKQRGIRLVAPSISNGQNGIPWLQTFISLTRDVPPDVISAHYYGTDGYDMIHFVQSLHDHFGMPVWIPEFAHLNNNVYDQRGLQAQVRQWMDSQWWIEKYAWFGCSRGDENNVNEASRLLDRNGHMTDLMYKYVFDA
jgi:hypothetical protein